MAPLVKPGRQELAAEDSVWKSRAQVAREFPQSPQGRLRQQRPRSAGSSASSTRMFRRVVCVTNAPVPQGRLRYQRFVALKPWGGPPSCDPAPLTTSLWGLWVSGNAGTGQWWNEQRGGDPITDRATQRGGDPKTDLRKEELSRQLGCEGRGPVMHPSTLSKQPGVQTPELEGAIPTTGKTLHAAGHVRTVGTTFQLSLSRAERGVSGLE